MFTDTEFSWSQNRGCHQRLCTNMLRISYIRWNVCNRKASLCVAACIKNTAADRRSCIRWKKSIGSRANCKSCTDWWEVGNCTGVTWGHETLLSYAETSLFLALVYCSKQKCWGKSLAVGLRYMEILYKIMWFKLLSTVYIKQIIHCICLQETVWKYLKKTGMALLYDQPSAGSERKNTIQDQTCDNVPSGRGMLHASEDDQYGAVVWWFYAVKTEETWRKICFRAGEKSVSELLQPSQMSHNVPCYWTEPSWWEAWAMVTLGLILSCLAAVFVFLEFIYEVNLTVFNPYPACAHYSGRSY